MKILNEGRVFYDYVVICHYCFTKVALLACETIKITKENIIVSCPRCLHCVEKSKYEAQKAASEYNKENFID